jgi:hypothetical protein
MYRRAVCSDQENIMTPEEEERGAELARALVVEKAAALRNPPLTPALELRVAKAIVDELGASDGRGFMSARSRSHADMRLMAGRFSEDTRTWLFFFPMPFNSLM